MKKFIREKYADMLLQICTDYKNKYPRHTGSLAQAVDRALETLDKYSYYILGMGYMLHVEDIPYLSEYVFTLKGGSDREDMALAELYNYLKELQK